MSPADPIRRMVVLMGMRASGKSTVGRYLSEQTGRPLIDLDCETLRAFPDCNTIAMAWHKHGQSAFRAAESRSLASALQSDDAIIALGGGTPVERANQMRLLHARDCNKTLIVYLKANATTLQQRLLAATGDRPPLLGSNSIDEVEDVLRSREPIYSNLASVTIDATLTTEVAGKLIMSSARTNPQQPND